MRIKTRRTKASDPARKLAHKVAQACHDQKAKDIVVLDLGALSTFADYFVIASGTSDRQVRAISDRIQESLKKEGIRPLDLEGYQEGHWVLIDIGSVVAHIFNPEAREYYALEEFWKKAKRIRFVLK